MINRKELDEQYGSLEHHLKKGNVWLTEFEKNVETSWEPEHWGADGFSELKDAAQFVIDSENGVLMMAFEKTDKFCKIVGIYQLDNSKIVHLHDHLSTDALANLPKDEMSRWIHAFRAVRSWTPEEGVFFDPTVLLPQTYAMWEQGDFEAVKIEDSTPDDFMKARWRETSVFSRVPENENPFEGDPSIWLTSFWGYSPETWGCVGFTKEGRPHNIKKETTNPFIMAIYVTSSAPGNSTYKGKLVGFYELSHLVDDKSKFIAPQQLKNKGHPTDAWRYSFKALRAWKFVDEYMPLMKDFYPEMYEKKQAQSVSTWSAELPKNIIKKLKAIPRNEVKVYGIDRDFNEDIIVPANKNARKGYNRSGPGRLHGYEVGEPKHTIKELYILKLSGDAGEFLGQKVDKQGIYKVGLSISPQTRCNSFNAALPKGKYIWEVFRTTRRDGHDPYENFEIAESGEMAMKLHLGEKPGNPDFHLGGEFYLASEEMIETAWNEGRKVALSKES